jgi:signal transduction histidine kinase
VIIVALVSGAFSGFIYKTVTAALERSFEAAEIRLRAQSDNPFFAVLPPHRPFVTLLSDELEEAKKEVALRLLAIDGIIVLISGIAGYFLADKTLQPIELAVNDQKRFVSDASHELRTPLTSIKSEIEVALRDKNLKLSDAKALVKSNLEEVDKMQKLTNYLLSLNRYESGSVRLTKEKADLSAIVEKVIEKYQKQASKKGLKIQSELFPTNAYVNSTSIEELISILIDNAIKYTSKGKVEILVVRRGKHAAIEISDTGIGIKAGELPYIFSRFYRGDSSRSKRQIDGYGLGLSIAHSIVSLNGGDIKVKSAVGKGSTFKIILPLS